MDCLFWLEGGYGVKPPGNTKYLLFGGTFVLANKLQFVGDKEVDGLPIKQWFLLRNILDLPPEPAPTITQIADAMDSSRQNVAKMLEVAQRQGLVAIEGSPSDRRSRSVRVTALGLTRVEQTAIHAQAFLDRLYEGIGPEERDAAGKVLLKMIGNLERIQGGLT